LRRDRRDEREQGGRRRGWEGLKGERGSNGLEERRRGWEGKDERGERREEGSEFGWCRIEGVCFQSKEEKDEKTVCFQFVVVFGAGSRGCNRRGRRRK
jgi:hypothetical protein